MTHEVPPSGPRRDSQLEMIIDGDDTVYVDSQRAHPAAGDTGYTRNLKVCLSCWAQREAYKAAGTEIPGEGEAW